MAANPLHDVILPAFGLAASEHRSLEDATVTPLATAEMVLSTGPFVVDPRFFPDGDIGALAVHGAVNDLVMMGAVPLALAVAFIVAEGFPVPELARIADSLGRAAEAARVKVVTGDTEVVGDGTGRLFVTITGLGVRTPLARPAAGHVRAGDVLPSSGQIGSADSWRTGR